MSEGHRLDKKVDHSYEELKALLLASDRDFDMEKIDKAYQFALESHGDQKRRSGVPYILHPVSVAYILVELGMDTESIVASLLHDVVEDTPVGLEEIKKLFGIEVANLTDGVTKLGRIPYSSREEQQAENLRKMLIAMADDIRVIIIKLADRLHNMRTIEFMPDQKRRDKALETMEVYAPIAHRLGIRALKEEMEDISLRYLDPIGYHEIESALAMKSGEREEFINKIKKQIYDRVSSVIPNVHLEGRVKSINGIYRKVFVQGKSMEEIYDIYAVRVIVDSLNDCYNVLGMIHDMYRPIPNRFKDYISTPKPNLYQSLHTTVLGKEGVPFEVQIRTWEMHHTAEYGIAAHWKYKENIDGTKSGDNEEAKLAWLRQILEWQRDTSDNKEFLSLIKNDMNLFSDNVYCFTPSGDVKNLPAGSTPVDFAYSIHSAVGNKMIGARVNGKLVTIDYVLKNGDRVEIITSQNSKGPSRDWLNIVKSAQAKTKINQWFKAELKEDNIQKGKDLIASYCKTKNIQFSDIYKPEFVEKVLSKYGFRDWDSVVAAVGHGALKEGQVVNKLQEEYEKKHRKEITDAQVLAQTQADGKDKPVTAEKSKSGIVVKGIHDVAVRFSKCCSPVPGDEIVGFVTRGRGVSIHRTDCTNIVNLPESDRARIIDAEWQEMAYKETGESYSTEIKIFANNRTGMLVDISRILTENKIDVTSMNCRTSKQGTATISMSFDIKGLEQLRHLVEKLRNVEGVLDIERTNS